MPTMGCIVRQRGTSVNHVTANFNHLCSPRTLSCIVDQKYHVTKFFRTAQKFVSLVRFVRWSPMISKSIPRNSHLTATGTSKYPLLTSQLRQLLCDSHMTSPLVVLCKACGETEIQPHKTLNVNFVQLLNNNLIRYRLCPLWVFAQTYALTTGRRS